MLAKDRLGKRRYGHVRHNNYHKSLIEPEDEHSLSWADPKRKEFWRTDVEPVLHKQEDKRRARGKVGLAIPLLYKKVMPCPHLLACRAMNGL